MRNVAGNPRVVKPTQANGLGTHHYVTTQIVSASASAQPATCALDYLTPPDILDRLIRISKWLSLSILEINIGLTCELVEMFQKLLNRFLCLRETLLFGNNTSVAQVLGRLNTKSFSETITIVKKYL